MGSLIKIWKTIVLPPGATVKRDGTVTWKVRGKKRTGKLSKTGSVTIQSDTWTAQFTDENGKTQRISTKTTVRSIAEKILAQYQTEVDRIRTGVATREELSKTHLRHITLEQALEQFKTKMVAGGNTKKHITDVQKCIGRICRETNITSLTDIRRETIERWLANEIQTGVHAAGTINHYLVAIKSFVQYLVEIELLPKNPLKPLRKLNEELNPRKKRRAMTAEEVERLLDVAAMDQSSKTWKDGERMLVYQLLLGTGLRSTELFVCVSSKVGVGRKSG